MVERFKGENFVELGIASGGSAALTALVAPPRKLVAVDLKANRVEALDELIAERGLRERVLLHYGVDQADRERLASILDDEFGDEPLGLVIDDASHRLEETRASFETLFPRLRPGGLFVIEDWNAEHLLGRAIADALADPSPELKAQFDRDELAGSTRRSPASSSSWSLPRGSLMSSCGRCSSTASGLDLQGKRRARSVPVSGR